MKFLYVHLYIFVLLFYVVPARAQKHVSLEGRVTDGKTGEPLIGVNIYLTDLKSGTITDDNGNYHLENLPKGKVQLQVAYVGYKTILKTVDLSTVSTLNFKLEPAVTELNQVVVTGNTRATEIKRTPSPVSVVPKSILLQQPATNIIDAIASQPGISQITTGSGISKPVIRGLGYNRVVVVNDGIRQEGQQWGDEHGIEIDEYAVNKVEILKGPASLLYGSDAMAGVINMIADPVLPEGKISGSLLTNYQSNNGLIGGSVHIAGNNQGFNWSLRYSTKYAHDYRNAYDGPVFNSGFRENAVTARIGLNKSWGYSHLMFSRYYLMPGMVEGDRDSATGKFVRPVAINDTTEGSMIVNNHELSSYALFIPYQKVYHYKSVLNNYFVLGNGNLKTTLGFQQNRRQEFANILTPNKYGLYFLLNTFNYDLRYSTPEISGWNISTGVGGMYQHSENKGSEVLVPEYQLFDFGIFCIGQKTMGKLDISGGLRIDTRIQHGKALYLSANEIQFSTPAPGRTQRFGAFDDFFHGFSGSIGATYQITGSLYAKLNLSKGYRAPNIAELGSNGVHEGTIRYEMGNPDLKPETSWQTDYALGLNTEHISAEVDLFYNAIKNFIFIHRLSSTSGGDSLKEGYTVFKFFPGNAVLFGGEAKFDIHPHSLDWLHFENSFSYVNASLRNQPDSMRYLPFTPPPRLESTLKANLRKAGKLLKNSYISFSVNTWFTQNHIYSAFNTETATPGYSLFNMGLGTDLVIKGKTRCSVFFSGSDLTNVAYQSHLSRLKYGDVNYVTGRTGVFNMGRNFSVKLIVPLNIR